MEVKPIIERVANLVIVKTPVEGWQRQVLRNRGYEYNGILKAFCREFKTVEEAKREVKELEEKLSEEKTKRIEEAVKEIGDWFYPEMTFKIPCKRIEIKRIFINCGKTGIFRFLSPKDGDLAIYLKDKLEIEKPNLTVDEIERVLSEVFGKQYSGGTIDIILSDLTKEKVKGITNYVKCNLIRALAKLNVF